MRARLSKIGIPIVVGDRVLLDTGAVVALVNASDPDHARCVAVWSTLRAELHTVEGVLVEACHLLRRARRGAKAAIGLVLDAHANIATATDARLRRAATLMHKYHDTPMDLVDALLVVTAEEANVRDVFTLDRRGFETYRLPRGARFRIVP